MTDAEILSQFIAWLGSTSADVIEVEDVDADGDDITIEFRHADLIPFLKGVTPAQLAQILDEPLNGGRSMSEPGVLFPPVDPTVNHDYELWTEGTRRNANMAALRALRQWRLAARGYLLPEERRALLGFSGWGGIKIDKLPEDTSAWTAEQLEALQDYKAAKVERRLPKSLFFRGVKQQFFTPVKVAAMMADLAFRAVRRPVQTVLEPSAGIGRFLGVMDGTYGPVMQETVPDGIVYAAAELDPVLQEFEEALYSDVLRARGAFEQVARRLESTKRSDLFDIVISNPPYPKRSGPFKAEHGSEWHKAAAYFTWATMRMLAPGGVLCTLVPVGQIAGADNENRDLRRFLLAHGHFVTAFALPADVFPGALVQTVVHCWVRRDRALTDAQFQELLATDPIASALLEGRYINRTAGAEDLFGVWRKSQRFPTMTELHGDEPVTLDRVPLAIPEGEYAARNPEELAAVVEILLKTTTAVDGTVPLGAVNINYAANAEVGSVLDSAIALDTRLAGFIRRRQSNPEVAEAGRAELLQDTQDFVARWGNPHTAPGLAGSTRQIPTLLAVVARTGAITDVLTNTVVDTIPGEESLTGKSIEDVVAFYCARLGACPEARLYRHFTPPPRLESLPESICLLIDAAGAVTLMTREVYTSGALYPRIENVESILAGEPDAWLRERVERQKLWLQENLGEKSIHEINFTPNSGFLTLDTGSDPYAILNDYIAYQMKTLGTGWGGNPTITLYQEHRKFKIRRQGDWNSARERLGEGENPKAYPAQWLWLLFFLGYLNNETLIPDFDTPVLKDTGTRRYQSTDFNARVLEDRQVEDEFRAWVLSNDKWHAAIERGYNRVYRGYVTETVSDAPLTISRWNNEIRLGPQQAQGVRWIAARGGGIVAFDVGIGKTFTGIAAIAWERQNGRCRRALVTMPNQLVVNWRREVHRALPDYRVCTIGYEDDLVGEVMGLTPISKAERVVQWRRVALGDYDLVLCPESTFWRDVSTSPETTRRFAEMLFTVQVDMGEHEEKIQLLKVRISRAQESITATKNEMSRWNPESSEFAREQHDKARSKLVQLEAVLGRLTAELELLTKGTMSDTAITTGGEEIESWVSGRKHRPTGLPEMPWRVSDPRDVLVARLRSVLVGAGDGTLLRGIKLKLKDTRWLDDAVAGESWLRELRKLDVVEILQEVDPIDGTEMDQNIVVPALATWDDLGIDLLVVDEAHNYKNLFAPERNPYGAQQSIAYLGAPSGDTARSWDLWLKTQYVLSTHNDRGVLLLTATPEKNSPLEIYNLISYVSTTCWSSRGIKSPNEFIERYLKIEETEVPMENEAAVAVLPAVMGFKNQFELWIARDQYSLIKKIKDVPTLAAVVPGEERIDITFDMHPAQRAMYKVAQGVINKLAEESQASGEKPDPSLTLRLRDLKEKITLDPRLLAADYIEVGAIEARMAERTAKRDLWIQKGQKGRPPANAVTDKERESLAVRRDILERISAELQSAGAAGDLPEQLNRLFPKSWIPPKYEQVARRIAEDPSCGHVVFVDWTEPLQSIAAALERHGIPRKRIGLMGGKFAKDPVSRALLADAFNGSEKHDGQGNVIPGHGTPPELDVLIGITKVMGEGLNLQVRTCAIHHVMLPWEPATLVQRNGRGARQGNVFKLRDPAFKVKTYYYLARYSGDAKRMDQVMGKADWQGSLQQREYDEVSNPAASMERVEMAFALNVEDPELAARELARIRAENRAKQDAIKVKEIRRRLGSLDDRARKIRSAKTPAERTAYARMYNEEAAQLKVYAGDLAQNIDDALMRILRAPTYYVPTTGFALSVGDRVEAKVGWHTQSVEILSVSPSVDVFTYRPFGTLENVAAYSLAELADKRAKGAAEIMPVLWDEERDRKEYLTTVNIASTVRAYRDISRSRYHMIVNKVGLANVPALSWDYGWRQASAEKMCSDFPPPLRMPNGDILLLTERSAWVRWFQRNGRNESVLSAADAFFPKLELVESDELILALREERVYFLDPGGEGTDGHVPNPVNPLLPGLRPFNLWDKDETKMLRESTWIWCVNAIREKAFDDIRRDVRASRKARGIVAPSSRTGGMSSDLFALEEQP